MNLATIGIIARKDLADVLRDRRTLIFMMGLPIVVMPLLMLGMGKFMARQMEAKEARVVRIAADTMTANTVSALSNAWYARNAKQLGVLFATLGLEAAGGFDALQERLQAVDDIETGQAGTPSEDGAMSSAMQAFKDLTEDQQQLLADSRAVGGLLARIEFVPLDDVTAEGALAQGVEVPENAPEAFQDPQLALAIQRREIEIALYIPPDAMTSLEESPLAVPFESLTEASTAESYDPSDFALLTRAPGLRSVPVHVLYDSSQSLSNEARGRIASFVKGLARFTSALRLTQADLPREFGAPVVLESANVATQSRTVQAILGGILPYLIIAFCFFGALYPAFDVTAGEKERFTLETLLLSPVTRLEIAVGKFLVVFIAAIVAAVLTTLSMALTFTHGILPADLMASFEIEFQPLALILTGSLILPVAALYSSSLLAVGLYARSFKEAQSYSVPLQFLFVLPGMVSVFPDVEPDSYLAWIPFVNISILMKELLKGNYLWGFYGITLTSTLILTGAALALAAWFFRRESVLLRA